MVEAGPDVGVQQELDDDLVVERVEVELAGVGAGFDQLAQHGSSGFERFVAVGRDGVEDRVVEVVGIELEAHPVLDDRVELLDPREVRVRHDLRRSSEHLVPEVGLQSGEQVLARRELQVDRSLRDPRRVGDPGDRGVGEAFLDSQLGGRVEDLSTPDLGGLEASLGRGVRAGCHRAHGTGLRNE